MKNVNNKGFSLIELMIVVAIIGILATVAIPNFQRFQGKAKQSEAKTQLSGFYMAQKSFQAEYSYYPGQFAMSGYMPSGNALSYRIKALDNGAGGPNNLPATVKNIACNSTVAGGCTIGNYNVAVMPYLENVAVAIAATTCTPAITNTSFTACASAKFLNSAAQDEWSITDGNVVTNVTSGI